MPIYEQWPIGCLLFHALGMSLSLLTGQPVEHRGTLFFHPSVHIPGYKGPLISLLCPQTSNLSSLASNSPSQVINQTSIQPFQISILLLPGSNQHFPAFHEPSQVSTLPYQTTILLSQTSNLTSHASNHSSQASNQSFPTYNNPSLASIQLSQAPNRFSQVSNQLLRSQNRLLRP